jgi:hypothetical protein
MIVSTLLSTAKAIVITMNSAHENTALSTTLARASNLSGEDE